MREPRVMHWLKCLSKSRKKTLMQHRVLSRQVRSLKENGNLVLYGVVCRSNLGHDNRKNNEIYLHIIGDLVRNAMATFERAKEKSYTDFRTAKKKRCLAGS